MTRKGTGIYCCRNGQLMFVRSREQGQTRENKVRWDNFTQTVSFLSSDEFDTGSQNLCR